MGEKRMSYGQRGGRGGYGGRGGGYGSGMGSFGSSFKKPVEVGKEYNVTISDTSRRGEGIAKIDGFVIFVAGGKQGQAVRIKITQVSNRFATGQVIDGSTATGSTATTSESTEKTTE